MLLDHPGSFNGIVTAPPGTGKLVVRCQQSDGDELHEGVGVYPSRFD